MSYYITLNFMVFVQDSQVLVEIRTLNVSDTRLEHYHYNNLLGHLAVGKCMYSLFMSISEEGKIKLFLAY